ncbi:unnamed protein product [Enterobius vermicularis]|uniref:Spore coat protein n=1 Tax=Enterobius vermicularis TaxID=51028 RepID=A0A0N4VAU0_ENTVE|nr:unnamed protein product [Enterobius vermicularis]
MINQKYVDGCAATPAADCTCNINPVDLFLNFAVTGPTTDANGCDSYTATCTCTAGNTNCQVQLFDAVALGGNNVGNVPFTGTLTMTVTCPPGSDGLFFRGTLTSGATSTTINNFMSANCVNA